MGQPPASLCHTGAVHLEIGSEEVLSPDLVSRVDSACDEVEDRVGDGVLLVHLRSTAPTDPSPDGATPAGSGPWPGEIGIETVGRWERALRRLERLPVPTVAVAERDCGGPAVEALLTTDYRFSDAHLRLCLAPGPGQPWPGMALYRLVNQVGVARARRLTLFGAVLSARQALDWGLVDETFVPPAGDLVVRVKARIAEMNRLPGSELAIRRRLMLDAAALTFEDALGAHLAACDRTLRRARRASPAEQILTTA